MKKFFIIVSALLFLFIAKGFAQSDFRDGFIITIKHDTIFGQIDYRSNNKNYESCLFSINDSSTLFGPNQINGYGFLKDKFFSSSIVKNAFVESLILGKISLFRMGNTYYIRKDHGEIYELSSKQIEIQIDNKKVLKDDNKWRGIIAYLVSDRLPNSNNVTKELALNEKNLTKLIVRYNKSAKDDFIEFKRHKPWTKVEIGLSLGVAKTDIHIKDETHLLYYLSDSYQSVNPTIGFILALSSPRIIENLALQSEIHFIKSYFSALVELNAHSINEFYDTYINLTTLSIPISIKYSVPLKKYTFYFQGGLNYNYNIEAKSKLLKERVYHNTVTTFPETIAFDINTNQIGLWGGIGVLKSFPKFNGSLTFRYFQLSNLNKYNNIMFSEHFGRFSFNLTISKK